MSATVDSLIDRLLTDQNLIALVASQRLKPLIGNTVYPASYAAPDGSARDDKGPRYCITELRDGTNICVIDSIPSQANRIETALLTDDYLGLVREVRVQAKLANDTVGIRHMLELGHRATDGAVLASTLEPEITTALRCVRDDPAPLASIAPMCLLMGVWDSRKNRTGLKLPRAFSATIEATDVSQRQRHAQYNSAWHANELASELQDAAGAKPSEIGLDGVPSGDGLGGVVVHGEIGRNAFLATNPLRANCSGKSDTAKNAARYIASLGLVALTMPASPWLRSGCNLVPDGTTLIEAVNTDGSRETLKITHSEAIAVAKQCAKTLGIDQLAPLLGEITADNIRKLASAKDESPAKAKAAKGKKTAADADATVES
ncbi:type I-U CRISPR-associated RAMP protein Csb1/Cas7u [Uliginosibacterium flavum]|uniref:Type I-U CRISPR-associated RAMP protein Csb1/Cas7u n=1 Tax=Uliginosibacterium flavum TaxID=1396831 RepID=A0ABV2TH11_9RHOO